jgi:hypothetical protein
MKSKNGSELIEEDSRWKIYSKGMEFKRRNKPLDALELLKSMNGVITEQINWFYLVVKCLMMCNQWK